jgi:S-adenosylmethionine hydrolase
MKGVIISVSPSSRIVDISHAIKPQDVDNAAFIVWSTYKFFPDGTIFVCVVDPGVGSQRNILCVETKNYIFLAPDNGLLKFVLNSESIKNTVAVANRKYFRDEVATTFHGRDIFAPVAAQLANGLPVRKLGAKIKPAVSVEQFVKVALNSKKAYSGKIIHVDHFGNVVTNFQFAKTFSPKLQLHFNKHRINLFCPTYVAAPDQKPFAIVGSMGLLEISIKNENAARFLRASVNQRITLRIS